ncbi:MAG: FG-GAP repeat protein [Flavobacteriales bacterium]|nr:FG-GAP repeat protein [Flavobacteriales bacterium]
MGPAPAVWWAFGGQANARFGSDVSTAGDVNGDGLSDILISAPLHDNGQTDEGRVYLYPGSTTIAGSDVPAWTAEGNQTTAQFGSSIASAGDVNADGFSDVLIGAPGTPTANPVRGGPTFTMACRPDLMQHRHGSQKSIRLGRPTVVALRAPEI